MTPDLNRLFNELSRSLDPLDLEFFAQICKSGVTEGVPWVQLVNGDILFGYSDYRDSYYKDIFERSRAVFEALGLSQSSFGAAFDALLSYGNENCEFPRLTRKSNFIPKGGVVIDVGTRAGHFLVKASRLAGPDGMVIGVDATAFAEESCQRHIAANGCQNVRFVRALVSDVDDAPAHFYHGSPGESFSGLFRETVGGTEQSIVTAAHHTGSFEAATRTIESLAVDLKLTRCDLIVLQINGAEVKAVRGMTRILNNFRPTLFVTCYQRPPGGEEPADAITGWVASMGYDVIFHQGTEMILRPLE